MERIPDRRLLEIERRLNRLSAWQADVARELRELDERCAGYDKVSELVQTMREEDKIAAAVTARIREQGARRWTRGERFVGLAVAFGAVGGFLIELARAIHG